MGVYECGDVNMESVCGLYQHARGGGGGFQISSIDTQDKPHPFLYYIITAWCLWSDLEHPPVLRLQLSV